MKNKNSIKEYLSLLNMKEFLCDIEDINILIKKHLSNLTFSNIDLLISKKVSLDYETMVDKIIVNQRGGYCFEHNKLIYEVLAQNGYNLKAVAARVLNNKNEEVAKTHRVTLLTYRGNQYLIDVGFGFASPNVAIKFGTEPTLTTLGTTYKIQDNRNGSYTLGIIKNNSFFTLYSFEMCNNNEADFELSNFYSYANKNSKFVNNLVVSKVLEDKILSLKNNSYYTIYRDETKKIEINTQEELQNILSTDFNYTLKDDEISYLYNNFLKEKQGN